MILGTMADIWGGIGVSIGDSKGDWFYRLNHEIRGPVGYQALVDKLLAGEINLTTEVSRDGATYFPLAQVKAFAPHLEEASHTQVRRITRRSNLRLALLTVPVLAALVALAVVLKHNYAHHQKESQQAAKLALAKAQPPSPESLSKLHLVALVSLGTESDVKITNTGAGKHLRHGKKRKHTKNADGPGPVDDYEPEETVSTCQLTQQDIFGTLRNQLNKLNVCVEDEKKARHRGFVARVA